MNSFARLHSKLLKRLVIAVALLVTVALGTSYVKHHHLAERFALKELSHNTLKTVTLPGGQTVVRYSAQALPKTQADRQGAPIAALLPAHWTSDPQPRYRPATL